jgi:DNA-binding MarR family transcriptional regulator
LSREKSTDDPREQLGEAISLEIRRSQNRSDAFDEAVSEKVGINRTDLRCLDIISQEGGRLTAGRLARLAGLTTGAMTTVLDRLERAGYARRVRDEVDRRRVQVELVEDAMQTFWPYYEPLADLSRELFGRYSEEELELILDFLRAGASLFEERLGPLGPS